jgi:hypothetical protein
MSWSNYDSVEYLSFTYGAIHVSMRLTLKVGSRLISRRSAPEEHNVYSLAFLLIRRSEGAQCGVCAQLHPAPDGAE